MSAPERPRLLVAVAGQVASGKSAVARALGRRIGASPIEADHIHDALLGAQPGERERWRSLEPAFERRVYAEQLARAEAQLAAGRAAVLDACFPHHEQRLAARALARRQGAPLLFVECLAEPALVRSRLQEREAAARGRGWPQLHDDLAARWEPIGELAPDEIVRVRSDGPVERAVAEALRAPCLRFLAHAGDAREPARPAAVTFDCWNTLLYEASWERAHALRVGELRAAAQEAGRDATWEEARRAFDRAWARHVERWQEGEATGAHEVARWGFAELGLEDPRPAAVAHLVKLFEELSHSGQVLALDGARRTLEALADAGLACALICDTGLTPGRVVRRHLDRLGLLSGLAVQVFSDEVGAPKPDPRMFRAALEPLAVEPEDALHVGDLRRTDVAGARSLGMASVRIADRHDDRTPLPDADHVVASHAGLLRLLGLQRAEPAGGD